MMQRNNYKNYMGWKRMPLKSWNKPSAPGQKQFGETKTLIISGERAQNKEI